MKSPSKLPRQPIDYSHRLPKGWEKNIPISDRQWIGHYIFSGERGSHGTLSEPLKLWNHPPEVKASVMKPNPQIYFSRRLFLWMPRRMYSFDFRCPHCKQGLRSKGVYNRVRLVLDIHDYYYLVSEYMHCRCGKSFTAWDHRMLEQLPYVIRMKFPAILTHKYAVDKSVLSFLRSRTLGNSPTALQNCMFELHSEHWMKKNVQYLEDCVKYKDGIAGLQNPDVQFDKADMFRVVPSSRWFLSCYVRDVWARLDSMKASITSVFGQVLKIDSTKKILRKLAGEAKDSATWVTNVGNEFGLILQSVVTASESNESLMSLADGIVKRYADAQVHPPSILYTDRDCCSMSGPSKFKVLFSEWPNLHIRLDIWHFMRRLAFGCSSEAHPLYGVFMSQLSGCIFEWDDRDYNKLLLAKKGQLKATGLKSPSEAAVRNAVTKTDLASHCRRCTRDVVDMRTRIEELILTMTGCTDILGVPILKTEIAEIWKEQKRHLYCIQDPPGFQLYSQVGEVSKGGIRLPVYRCARGSTSVESFHHHLLNFIPGTSANYVHFQAYLIDGICRWNALRTDPLIGSPMSKVRSFDFELTGRFNDLHAKIFGTPFNEKSRPNKHTGEAIGVEFLFKQTNQSFTDTYVDDNTDDGCFLEDDDNDNEIQDDSIFDDGDQNQLEGRLIMEEVPDDDDENDDEGIGPENSSIDSKGIPGLHKVDRLARALMRMKGISLTEEQTKTITALYDDLEEFDKKPVQYQAVQRKAPKGRFASRKKSCVPGIVQMKRCFFAGAFPALSPSRSRLVEAICIYLCEDIPSASTKQNIDGSRTYHSRWRLILKLYNTLRARLFNSKMLLDETNLTLFNINETTLRLWFKEKTRRDEVTLLLRGKRLPGKLTCSSSNLPEPRPPPQYLQGDALEEFSFPEPEDRSGMARLAFRRKKTNLAPTSSMATPPPPPQVQLLTVQNPTTSCVFSATVTITNTPFTRTTNKFFKCCKFCVKNNILSPFETTTAERHPNKKEKSVHLPEM